MDEYIGHEGTVTRFFGCDSQKVKYVHIDFGGGEVKWVFRVRDLTLVK